MRNLGQRLIRYLEHQSGLNVLELVALVGLIVVIGFTAVKFLGTNAHVTFQDLDAQAKKTGR